MSSTRIVTINGLDINVGGLYLIQDRPDGGAPTGYKSKGATKLPSEGIVNLISCSYHTTGKNKKGIFDTGFYVGSPCYRGMSAEEKQKKVDKLNEYIVKPYEAKHGEGKLDHTNEEFWEEYLVELHEGKVLSTNDEDSFLDLYMLIHNCAVESEKLVGDPRFKDAQFRIVDKAQATTIEKSKANLSMKAMKNFGVLLETDKAYLVNIMKYLGISADIEMDDETLNTYFYQWIQQSNDQSERFLKVFNFSKKAATKEIPNLYALVLESLRKNKIIKGNSGYEYDGTDLGGDLRTVAQNLTKKEFKEVTLNLMQSVESK